MTVATFTQPDFTTQDAAVAVLAEVGRAFACHQSDPSAPDMTVVVDAGASNYYSITNNIVAGASVGISDGGTGVNKTVSGNH